MGEEEEGEEGDGEGGCCGGGGGGKHFLLLGVWFSGRGVDGVLVIWCCWLERGDLEVRN